MDKESILAILAEYSINNYTEAQEMGRAVGDGMYYVIVDVLVRPEYQSKRIGATIVNRLVEMIQNDAPEGSRGSIQLLAAKGKEEFYVKQGFKILPHEFCGPALRKVIYT